VEDNGYVNRNGAAVNRLAILGGGGHGKVVADAAECSGRWKEIVFYDDAWPAKADDGPWPVAGSFQSFLEHQRPGCDVVVAIGNNRLRLAVANQLIKTGFSLVNVVHPSATVSRHAHIGIGTVIFAGAVVNIGAVLGTACIINTRATVEHDCLLGAAVHVSPGANLAGEVTIGDASWIGIGSCVRQQIDVGRGVIIGAGAVVVKPVPDGLTVAGNPATILHAGRTRIKQEPDHAEYPFFPVAELYHQRGGID
jgi:sugar O-acyltransferase (sialic acid O-acetyltransferase NeuD family)